MGKVQAEEQGNEKLTGKAPNYPLFHSTLANNCEVPPFQSFMLAKVCNEITNVRCIVGEVSNGVGTW